MKILSKLIERGESTLDEVEWYAENALHLKSTNKELSDTYLKIAETHISIFNMLHDMMVKLIEKERHAGVNPPQSMLEMWDYSHKKMMKEFAEAKYIIEEVKKTY